MQSVAMHGSLLGPVLATIFVRFLQFLNSHHNNIKFTIEFEENSGIPFLDILVEKVVYNVSFWDCDDFYIGKMKPRLQDT